MGVLGVDDIVAAAVDSRIAVDTIAEDQTWDAIKNMVEFAAVNRVWVNSNLVTESETMDAMMDAVVYEGGGWDNG